MSISTLREVRNQSIMHDRHTVRHFASATRATPGPVASTMLEEARVQVEGWRVGTSGAWQ
jgi:hypothetical protein